MINFSKLSRLSYQLFYGLFTLAMLWILLVNVQVDFQRKPIIFIIFLLYGTGFLFLRKYLRSKNHDVISSNDKLKKWVELAFWVFLFVCISVIGLTLRVEPTWDYGMVHRSALEWAQEGKLEDLSYFARYPNNNLMLLITVLFYKVIHFFNPASIDIDYIKASIVLNSLIVSLSIFLTSQSAKELYGSKGKKVTVFFLVFLTPIMLYTEIFYTDIIGLLFISLLAYLLIKRINDFTIKDGILIGIIIAFGFKLKAFIIIILIALIIVLLLKNNLHFKKKILLIIMTVFSFVVVNTVLTISMDKIIGLDEELYEEYQFPASHWIMMSLHPEADGGFVTSDYEETRDAGDKKAKEELISKKLSNRVDSLGKDGLVHHLLYKKIKRTWTVGSMAVDDYAQRENINQTPLHDFMTKDGKNHTIFYVLSQSAHLLIIVLMFANSIMSLFKSNDELNILNITIFGLILFLVIWECNSRYLFSFIPFFVLVSLSLLTRDFKKISKNKSHPS